ncbi:hypothetical protein [Cupriavidus pauculus]|uniref:Lipoprotein n=1 Tax=Cupriavidus pauculus TaxID=82633 RepID=A0A3G8HAE5_9BURK|nr:hypothetical protein [Cupriavidus pauculus]AZG16562.1 hypothetical protein EHF44_24615 [Cupriavidus pauculus]
MRIITGLFGLLAGCTLVAGCSTSAPKAPTVPAFQADARSGKPKRAMQGWIAANRAWGADKELAAILAQPEQRGARDVLASAQCSEPAPRTAAARAAAAANASSPAFLVSGTRLVTDLYTNPDDSRPEQRKRDAIDASGVDVGFSAAGFRGVRCVVLARYAEGDAPAQPGLLAVLAIEQKLQDGKFTDYFRFRPLHVRAANATAKTAAGGGGQAAQVTLAFALVARQLVVDNQGAARFAELGSAATTVARVRLDGEATTCAPGQCSGMSPPVPVPVAKGTVVVALGVSEAGNVGDVGADIDQARLEQEAIQAARGTPGAAPATPPPLKTAGSGSNAPAR